ICTNLYVFFFSSRRRHTRSTRDWSSDVCSSDLPETPPAFRDQIGLRCVDVRSRNHKRVQHDSCRSHRGAGGATRHRVTQFVKRRSEERRVGKEGRSRWWWCNVEEKTERREGASA